MPVLVKDAVWGPTPPQRGPPAPVRVKGSMDVADFGTHSWQCHLDASVEIVEHLCCGVPSARGRVSGDGTHPHLSGNLKQ